jgi:Acyl-CoA thioesterase C-terminal domain/Acyl-CoA thioesterase N-terminal domain
MDEAFYLRDGDRFIPTDLTRGPWSPDAQHAGPAAALMAREIESLEGERLQMARFTVDVLRPVPLKPLRVEARAVRSGRSTQYAEATLSDEAGEIARATAWRIRGAARDELDLDPIPQPSPEDAGPAPFFEMPWSPSYFDAMEWRLARGTLDAPGPAAVWMRMRYALVEGEEPSPVARVLAAADSGNGISWALPLETSIFINTELTVHLARMPEDQWVCLDARTLIGSEGVGLAESILWDRRSMIGRGAQALLVGARP